LIRNKLKLFFENERKKILKKYIAYFEKNFKTDIFHSHFYIGISMCGLSIPIGPKILSNNNKINDEIILTAIVIAGRSIPDESQIVT
jgi:hypothetical protein